MSKKHEQEILQVEVQQFRATPGIRRLLLITFLLVIFSVPVIQAAIELWKGQSPVILEAFTQRPSRINLRAYEKNLEDSSFLVQRVRPIVYLVWHTLFRYAGEKVIIGREGWLFYRHDVDYLLGRSGSESRIVREEETAAREDAVSTIVDFKNQLARRSIRLLVMPVPGKPSIYPERITWRFQGRQVSSPSEEVIRRLREQGVEVIDLFPVFRHWRQSQDGGASLYLRLDTHWTAETARMTGES